MIRRTSRPWRYECHLNRDQVVKLTVLAVVDGGSKWEYALIQTLIPVLLCLQEVGRLRAVAVESDSRVAISASTRSPVVLGVFTWQTILDCLKKEFLYSFAGLEPFWDSRILALPSSVRSSGPRPRSFASAVTCCYRLHSFHEVKTLSVVFVSFVLVGRFRTCLNLCSDRVNVSMVCSESIVHF